MSRLASRLGLQAPVFQAPMAGVQNHRLAAAVCSAGGLGSLPGAMLTPEGLRSELAALQKAACGRPYNVNFFCHTLPPSPDAKQLTSWHAALKPYYSEFDLDAEKIPSGAGRVSFSAEVADVLEEFKPAVVSFHFGLPSKDLLDRVKSWGSLVMSSATTIEEGEWLEARGADAVIAQGLEAGGHRGMFLTDDLTTQVGTFSLLPQLVKRLSVPVVAAGGIADAAGVQAARALGADAVQVGTTFLCSDEATTSKVHRAALQSPVAQHTAVTNLFTGRPARGIMNRIMREMGPISGESLAFPLNTAGVTPLRAAAEAQGTGDFSPLWAGQNVNSPSLPAAEITRTLMSAWSPASPGQGNAGA